MTVAPDIVTTTASAAGMTGQPLTARCAGVFPKARHVVLGISPFNSYFKTDRIVDMIDWAMEHFDTIDFFTPDEAAAYTLQAQGYDADKAMSKARSQARYVHNKIHSAIDEVCEEDLHERVYGLERLRELPRYAALRGEAERRFASDEELRAEIMGTSSWILDKKLTEGQPATEDQVLLAVQYFLDELPLFVDSPGIFGVDASCFVYHQRVDFLEKFYSRELSWEPVQGQGFTVVVPDDSPELAAGLRF